MAISIPNLYPTLRLLYTHMLTSRKMEARIIVFSGGNHQFYWGLIIILTSRMQSEKHGVEFQNFCKRLLIKSLQIVPIPLMQLWLMYSKSILPDSHWPASCWASTGIHTKPIVDNGNASLLLVIKRGEKWFRFVKRESTPGVLSIKGKKVWFIFISLLFTISFSWSGSRRLHVDDYQFLTRRGQSWCKERTCE